MPCDSARPHLIRGCTHLCACLASWAQARLLHGLAARGHRPGGCCRREWCTAAPCLLHAPGCCCAERIRSWLLSCQTHVVLQFNRSRQCSPATAGAMVAPHVDILTRTHLTHHRFDPAGQGLHQGAEQRRRHSRGDPPEGGHLREWAGSLCALGSARHGAACCLTVQQACFAWLLCTFWVHTAGMTRPSWPRSRTTAAASRNSNVPDV